MLTICKAEDPESRRELAISDLHVVRDLVTYLTFPTSGTGLDSARALLLLDELSMLETTSLGTDAARQQRAGAMEPDLVDPEFDDEAMAEAAFLDGPDEEQGWP